MYPIRVYYSTDSELQSCASALGVEEDGVCGGQIAIPYLHYQYLSSWFRNDQDKCLRINRCYAKLKGGKHLLGAYNSLVYEFNTNAIAEWDMAGLLKIKNFRLRKLKNISKAKKIDT